jgi:hypothetical protein
MDINTILTDTPIFKLVKEYETNPSIDELTEIFVVVYRVDLPNWQQKVDKDENLKESMRYLFFNNLEKAIKQYKYYGPKGAVLSRMITDDDELIELAERSNFTLIEEEETKETPPQIEDTVKDEKSVILNDEEKI